MSREVDAEARGPAAEHVPLLRQRAAALARAPRDTPPGDIIDAVLFELGDERFAIDGSCVLQVAVLREFTPLPGARAPLFGVTHWRGTVLTVLDLRSALGVRVRGLTDLGRIIVLRGGDRTFGVLADRVHTMVQIDLAELRPVTPDDSRGGSLLRGITPDGVLLLEIDALSEAQGER